MTRSPWAETRRKIRLIIASKLCDWASDIIPKPYTAARLVAASASYRIAIADVPGLNTAYVTRGRCLYLVERPGDPGELIGEFITEAEARHARNAMNAIP